MTAKLHASEKRAHHVRVPVTRGELRALKGAAKHFHVSLAEYLRSAALQGSDGPVLRPRLDGETQPRRIARGRVGT